MKQSAPVMVNIRVRRVCEARINGIERINYTVSIRLRQQIGERIWFDDDDPHLLLGKLHDRRQFVPENQSGIVWHQVFGQRLGHSIDGNAEDQAHIVRLRSRCQQMLAAAQFDRLAAALQPLDEGFGVRWRRGGCRFSLWWEFGSDRSLYVDLTSWLCRASVQSEHHIPPSQSLDQWQAHKGTYHLQCRWPQLVPHLQS